MNTYKGSSIGTSMENSRNSLRRIARNDDTEFSHQSILNAMDQFVRSVSTMDETILVPCRLMDLKVGDAEDTTAANTNKKSQQDSANSKQQILAKSGSGGVGTVLNGADLFDMYNMLHAIKGQLLWGQEEMGLVEGVDQLPHTVGAGRTATYAEKAGATPQTQQQTVTIVAPQQISTQLSSQSETSQNAPGHVRRPSTVSVSSTNSCTSGISDTDSELGNENDSGIDELTKANNQSSSMSTTSSSASSDTNTTVDRTQLVAHNFRRHLAGLHRSLRQMTDAAQYLTKRYQHDIGQPGQLWFLHHST